MSFTLEQRPEMHIVGIAVRTSNAPGKAEVDIPNHWMRFQTENISGKIPNKVSDHAVALYCDYEGDHTKPYTLILGYPVTLQDSVPEGCEARTIPAGHYAKFACQGKPPASIFATWQTIWQETNLNRTFIADYELYTSPDDIAIFIGL